MTEPNSSSEQPPENSEPATGPVLTPPRPPGPVFAPMGPPPPAYARETSRLNKAAAWVGIAAGSVFIVAVIFGSGFVLGKQVGHGPRDHHRGGHEMMMRPGPAMSPMGPRGEFERRPGFSGPFGPGGPMIEIPRPPGGSGGSDSTTAPARP
ncbi:MAG: hypothetical protein KDB44_16130 [Mycobacterium sp.]|nr:hypothetical protein [Mycobacterium sp.]